MSKSTMNISEENQRKLKEVIKSIVSESYLKDEEKEDHEQAIYKEVKNCFKHLTQWFMSQNVHDIINKWIDQLFEAFKYDIKIYSFINQNRFKKIVSIFNLFLDSLTQANDDGYNANDFIYEEVMMSDCFDSLPRGVMEVMFDLPKDGYNNYTPEQKRLVEVHSYTIEKMCYNALCEIYNYEDNLDREDEKDVDDDDQDEEVSEEDCEEDSEEDC